MKRSFKRSAAWTAILVGLALSATRSTYAESIKYCEEISGKLGQYTSKKELFADLAVKARRKAVNQILKAQLEQFTPALLKQDVFVDSLLHIVEFNEIEQVSEGLLTPCVVLKDATINESHKKRFTPVEVGLACSYDEELLKKQVGQIKSAFVGRFFSKNGEEEKPASIAGLLAQPEKIAKKFGAKKLEAVLREQSLQPNTSSVEEASCTSLTVYPIELYALSVPYLEELKSKKQTSQLTPHELKMMADNHARWNGLDPQLFRAVIQQESKWSTKALSHKGAVGLTQLMPTTAKAECGLKKTELSDPNENLGCGAHYLAKNMDMFNNNVRLALCAYNAGPGAAIKGKCLQYSETRHYVKNIMADVGI